MGNGHRKKPFSGKQKKKQLQERRVKNVSKREKDSDNEEFEALDEYDDEKKHIRMEGSSKKEQMSNNKKVPPTRKLLGNERLHSVFEKLSPQEINNQRKASMKDFTRLPPTALEVSIDNIYTTVIDFPKRPPWHYGMTKEELEANEEHYFQQWLDDVYNVYPKEELSFFEHNLDVWRQLWRVLEISDIILIVVDIRNPLLHFPPSLYNYVVKDLKRNMILVFNKVDLVAEHTVYAWTKYFEEQFPEINVVEFSCYSRDNRIVDDTSTVSLQKRTKRPKKRRYQALGIKELIIACKNVRLVKRGAEVNWEELIEQYNRNEADFSITREEEVRIDVDESSQSDAEFLDTGEEENVKQIENQLRLVDIQNTELSPHKELITIGLVGHPNVGKSSLVNSILGRTVVSISRTPGHTKHFQTIHLSTNVRLCDSPGLVFPSLLPKQLQILSGMYPISQVQEPYSTIQYMAERIPLESILKLDPPETLQNKKWSAWHICEAFAIKRRYYTKASRPDVYRAANLILRLSNDGRILLSFKPPGFFTSLKYLIAKRNDSDLQMKIESEKVIKSENIEKPKEFYGQLKQKLGGYFELLADDVSG